MQVGLVPAGGQQKYKFTLATSTPDDNGKCMVAYCSTLSVYLFTYDPSRQYSLTFLNCACLPEAIHLSAFAWNYHENGQFVVASEHQPGFLHVFDVDQGEFQHVDVFRTQAAIVQLAYSNTLENVLAALDDQGTLRLGHLTLNTCVTIDNNVTTFSWSPNKSCLVYGDKCGNVYSVQVTEKLKLSKRPLNLLVKKPTGEDVPLIDPKSPIAVQLIAYEPHEGDVFLVCFDNARLFLVHHDGTILNQFDRPAAALSSLTWLKDEPGNFITCDTKSSVMRVWNVSSNECLGTTKLLSAPVHELIQLDKSLCFITFTDGTVGAFNTSSKSWSFLQVGSHSDTIFCVDSIYVPEFQCSLVATGSYDGTIKLWDLYGAVNLGASKNTTTDKFTCKLNGLKVYRNINAGSMLQLLDTIPPGSNTKARENNGIWYSVAFSSDASMLVAGSSCGTLLIYDIRKARIVKELRNYHNGPIYSVKYCSSESDGDLIATTSGDKTSAVLKVADLSRICEHRAVSEIFGCCWNPHDKSVLACGLGDGTITIWNTAHQFTSPELVMTGHSGRVFTLVWSPVFPYLLASGSDDKTVRLWNVETGKGSGILVGHEHKIRGMCWSPVVPFLLLSGSWDARIRVWNVQNCTCLAVIDGHIGDVYGLNVLQQSPFHFISTSRDSTLRVWSFDGVMDRQKWMLYGSFADRDFDSFRRILSEMNVSEESILYSLTKSRPTLESKLDGWRQLLAVFNIAIPSDFFACLYDFFDSPSVKFQSNIDQLSVLPKSCAKQLAQEKAKSLEDSDLVTTLSKRLSLSENSLEEFKKELSKADLQQLREAAMLWLKTGNVRKYCETLCLLGEWERALAVAPTVSIDFWKHLSKKYSQFLLSQKETVDQETLIAFSVCGGNVAACARKMAEQKETLCDAFLLADTFDAHGFENLQANHPNMAQLQNHTKISNLIAKSASSLLIESQCPSDRILAACWHLNRRDATSAFECLLPSNQFDFAFVLAALLEKPSWKTQVLKEATKNK